MRVSSPRRVFGRATLTSAIVGGMVLVSAQSVSAAVVTSVSPDPVAQGGTLTVSGDCETDADPSTVENIVSAGPAGTNDPSSLVIVTLPGTADGTFTTGLNIPGDAAPGAWEVAFNCVVQQPEGPPNQLLSNVVGFTVTGTPPVTTTTTTPPTTTTTTTTTTPTPTTTTVVPVDPPPVTPAPTAPPTAPPPPPPPTPAPAPAVLPATR